MIERCAGGWALIGRWVTAQEANEAADFYKGEWRRVRIGRGGGPHFWYVEVAERRG